MQILTALGIPYLYEEIKKELNVFKTDIQYREGIIEVLKNNNDINIIIIYEKVLGEIGFDELIDKIKIFNNEIKIIFILENKNEELEKLLIKKNIKKIFYNNEINFKQFIYEIKGINSFDNNSLKIENEKLKKIIIEKNYELKRIKNEINKLNNVKNKNEKIIIISKFNYYEIKKYKKKINNKIKNNKIEFLQIKKINSKIKNYDKIIILLYAEINEIKNIISLINKLNNNFFIENKKINLLIIKNKKINIEIIKNIFKNNLIIGQIK